MDNLDFLYSLFNQYIFQDAKNNIEYLEYYIDSNPATIGNTLAHSLLDVIRNKELVNIDEPLFRSVLIRDKKNPQEQENILRSIIRWKNYDKKQIEPQKELLRDICANSLINKLNYRLSSSPYELFKSIKNSEIKLDDSDTLGAVNFANLDINSMVAENYSSGYPSSFPWINDLFEPLHQYEAGQMVMITMPPGCMSGDTEVILSDGTIETLEDLYRGKRKNIPIFSYNTDKNIREETSADDIQISKYVNSWYVIEIGEKKFRVTENHPFLIEQKGWVKAEDLKPGDILVVSNYKNTKENLEYRVKSVSIENLKDPQPVYDIVNAGVYHNYSVNIDDKFCFFSHNTGKTLFMMTEALNFAISTQEKVNYLAMGDMKVRDFVIRMGSIFTGMSFGDTTCNLESVYSNLKQFTQDKLTLSVVPAASITVDEYIDFVLANGFKIVFIDYDSNFLLKGSDSMYNDFGDVYNKLTKLTQAGILVFIAAQPKVVTWTNPTIELGDVGESARKIHTVDILFTAGRFSECPNHLGIFKCCKNRRGEEGARTGYIRLGNGRFKFIPVDLAHELANNHNKRNYTDAEIDQMVRAFNNNIVQMGNLNQGLQQQNKQTINNPFH